MTIDERRSRDRGRLAGSQTQRSEVRAEVAGRPPGRRRTSRARKIQIYISGMRGQIALIYIDICRVPRYQIIPFLIFIAQKSKYK